jgi:hypothetical protein
MDAVTLRSVLTTTRNKVDGGEPCRGHLAERRADMTIPVMQTSSSGDTTDDRWAEANCAHGHAVDELRDALERIRDMTGDARVRRIAAEALERS